MQKKTRDETVKAFERELEGVGAESSGKPYAGERTMYLETQPASANGYNTRDLPTLVGSLEDLEIPRVREGDFHPRILSYRKRIPLELSEAIPAFDAVGLSTRRSPRFWERIYSFWSTQGTFA